MSTNPSKTHLEMLKGAVMKTSELQKILGSRQAIKRHVDEGHIFQVCRGIYSIGIESSQNEATFKVLNKYFSDAIISGKSALVLQGLYDKHLEKLDLDVPREDSPPRKHELFQFHRKSNLAGWEEISIKGVKIKIYVRERCLFEAYSELDEIAFQKVVIKYCKTGIKLSKVEEIGKNHKDLNFIVSSIKLAQATLNSI